MQLMMSMFLLLILLPLPSPEVGASVFSSVKWHIELDAFMGPSKPRKLGLTEWGFLFIPTLGNGLITSCWVFSARSFLRARSKRATGTSHVCAGHI